MPPVPHSLHPSEERREAVIHSHVGSVRVAKCQVTSEGAGGEGQEKGQGLVICLELWIKTVFKELCPQYSDCLHYCVCVFVCVCMCVCVCECVCVCLFTSIKELANPTTSLILLFQCVNIK